MTDLSVDRTKAALTKAQREVKRAEEDRDAKLSTSARTDGVVTSAQSTEHAIHAQITGVKAERASLEAQELSTDPANEPALRRLGSERSFRESQLRSLEGAAERAKVTREQAQADASAASAAFRAAEDALKKARDHLTDCERDTLVAFKVAAGEPLTQYEAERVAFRERTEEEDHLRKVRYTWAEVDKRWPAVMGERNFSVNEHDAEQQKLFDQIWAEKYGGKPPSEEPPPPAVKTEPPSEKPLQPGEHGWGRHRAQSFESRVTPPVPVKGFSGGTESGYDPFAPEHD